MSVPGRLIRFNPEEFPDSEYARALRSGVSGLRFAPELEALYTQGHLERLRLRVRIWFFLNCLLGVATIIGWFFHHPPPGMARWPYAVADVSALVLAGLAWTGAYERRYMVVARVLVPILGASIAVFVAQGMAAGFGQLVGVLTINVIAVFFFAGLLFRAALLATTAILVAFTAAALHYGGSSTLLGGLPMLVIIAAIGIVSYRDIERSHRRNFLESALMAELIARDELSGLLNRRAFDEHMLRVWQHAQRDRRTLAVLMIDIDNFKAYNDAHGHQAGDGALRSVAQLLKGIARRPLDLAARYGGDEFIAVLYDLSREHVADIAEQLRGAIQEAVLRPPATGAAGPEGIGEGMGPAGATKVTVSIGVGVVLPVMGRTYQGAIQLADEALYEAKQAGRNRVVIKAAEDYYRLNTGSFRASAIEPA